MGMGLVRAVLDAEDMTLSAALERADHPSLGKDVGVALGGSAVNCVLSPKLETKGDDLLDVSSPEGSVACAEECVNPGVPIVVGTTGRDAQQAAALEKCSEKIACLIASNMSVGVNLLFQLAAETAERLGREYDVEIVEAHHRFKKDAPSGTALTLLDRVARALGRDAEECATFGRKGATGPRQPDEIGVHSIRAGGIVGDHTVIFSSPEERLELTHKAHTRDCFISGALRAARFIIGKPPGIYGMEDVLSGGA